MTDWHFDVPTRGSKVLPPAPRSWEALSSQGYDFEAAVADLIDNSVDAEATNVLIHFLRDGDHLVSLLVVDDGKGMDEHDLDIAMTVGGQRDYAAAALGMFGTGLKSASLSQARSVTVISKTSRTLPAGRRWVMERAKGDHRCDIVDTAFAHEIMGRYYDRPITSKGTIVRWDGVKDFPRHGGSNQTDLYLHKITTKLRMHLGLHLHRFLSRGDFKITIAVEDIRTRVVYLDFEVEAIDPFDYPVSGDRTYPRVFSTQIPDVGEVKLRAHIWTPRSNLDGYRGIGSVMERQGFYFYRHDRLVQAGGWNKYRQAEQHLSLARVAIDLPPEGRDVFRLTVRKAGVETSPAFAASLERAHDVQGATFTEYLVTAQNVYRESRRRVGPTRDPVIPPGKGIPPEVRQVIEEELPVKASEEPIQVRWQRLDSGQFFELDRENHVIWLNSTYRGAILGGRRGGLNDAPLIKSLLYLMLHKVFESSYSGSREKDNLQMWQTILTASARSEMKRLNDDV